MADAARALGAVGDHKAVPTLAKAIADRDSSVRKAAARALADIGKPAVPGLIRLLKHKNWHVRLLAAWGLGEIEDRRAIPALRKALKDRNLQIRRTAEQALRAMNAYDNRDPDNED